MRKIFFILLAALLFSACNDKAIVSSSKQDLKDLNCIALAESNGKFVNSTLSKFYHFDKNCSNKLFVSQKSAIVCNSNQNVDKKILASFPSGYIRLELYHDKKLIFSYYKDLTHSVDEDDIKEAFDTLKYNINK